MDIHPYTSHDIARLRGEERLLRAQEAQRAREVAQLRRAAAGVRRIRRRKVVNALPHTGPNAV